MSSQSFTRSSFSRRSLHLAVGVTAGSLEPRPAARPRLRCFLPTRGGGTGGSYFFFLSWGVGGCTPRAAAGGQRRALPLLLGTWCARELDIMRFPDVRDALLRSRGIQLTNTHPILLLLVAGSAARALLLPHQGPECFELLSGHRDCGNQRQYGASAMWAQRGTDQCLSILKM